MMSENKQVGSSSSQSLQVYMLLPETSTWLDKSWRSLFQSANWNVEYLNEINECFEKIESRQPDLLVVDAAKDGHQGLIAHIKAQWMLRDLPVIVFLDTGFNQEKPGKFFVFGDKVLNNPSQSDDPIEKESFVAESKKLVNTFSKKGKNRQTVRFRFPTKDRYLNQSKKYCDMLVSNTPLNEEEEISMKAAIRESIQNAAQHGNRYRDQAHITCTYLRDFDKLLFRVEDEGEGFDHESYLENIKEDEALSIQREEQKKGKYGGFGILLMMRCTDKIRFNDEGNQITLMKTFPNN